MVAVLDLGKRMKKDCSCRNRLLHLRIYNNMSKYVKMHFLQSFSQDLLEFARVSIEAKNEFAAMALCWLRQMHISVGPARKKEIIDRPFAAMFRLQCTAVSVGRGSARFPLRDDWPTHLFVLSEKSSSGFLTMLRSRRRINNCFKFQDMTSPAVSWACG